MFLYTFSVHSSLLRRFSDIVDHCLVFTLCNVFYDLSVHDVRCERWSKRNVLILFHSWNKNVSVYFATFDTFNYFSSSFLIFYSSRVCTIAQLHFKNCLNCNY